MMKVKPSSGLKILIDLNRINISTKKSVEWASMKQASIGTLTNFSKVANIGLQLANNLILGM